MCVKTKGLVLHERKLCGREKDGERRRKFGHQGLGFIINRGVIISGERRREGR